MAGKKLSKAAQRRLALEEAKKERLDKFAKKPEPEPKPKEEAPDSGQPTKKVSTVPPKEAIPDEDDSKVPDSDEKTRQADGVKPPPQRKADDQGDTTFVSAEPTTDKSASEPQTADIKAEAPPLAAQPVQDDIFALPAEDPFTPEATPGDLPPVDPNNPFSLGGDPEPPSEMVPSSALVGPSSAPPAATQDLEEVEPEKDLPIDTAKIGAVTSLVSGVQVKYEASTSNSKIFVVSCNGTEEEVMVKKGASATVAMDTKDEQVKITFVHDERGQVSAEVQGGKTKLAKAREGAGAVGRFLSAVKYHLPEVTIAGLGSVFSAVIYSSGWIKGVLAGAHIPVVAAVAAVTVGLAALSYFSSRKERNQAELTEEQ